MEPMQIIRRRYIGRNWLTIGAVLLFVVSGYEFYVRMDMLFWACQGLYNLCQNKNIPIFEALHYFDAGMFTLMAYLLVLTLFGVLAIVCRNRPKAAWLLAPGAVLLALFGAFRLSFFRFAQGDFLQMLKLLPLGMIVLGAIVNLSQYGVICKKSRRLPRRERVSQLSHTEDLPLDRRTDEAKALAKKVQALRADGGNRWDA